MLGLENFLPTNGLSVLNWRFWKWGGGPRKMDSCLEQAIFCLGVDFLGCWKCQEVVPDCFGFPGLLCNRRSVFQKPIADSWKELGKVLLELGHVDVSLTH